MADASSTLAVGEGSINKTLTAYGHLRHEMPSAPTTAVIVALPSPLDPIRLIGDEDKHTTLLFFGEVATLGEGVKSDLLGTLQQVSQMVGPFGERVLALERLGEDTPPALVAKLSNSYLENLRSVMMVNPSLRASLSNAQQYPNYTPHVTLGYPDYAGEAEVRKLARDIRRVSFDRLALWWGGEQIEFPLTPRFDSESEDAVGWSADLFENYLAHYGKLGMKWGVRNGVTTGKSAPKLSDDAASARALLSKSSTSASNSEIRAALERMRLESDFNKVQATLIPPSRAARSAAYVKNLLSTVGNEQVNRVAKAAGAVAIENALQNKSMDTKKFAKTVGERITPGQKSKKKK